MTRLRHCFLAGLSVVLLPLSVLCQTPKVTLRLLDWADLDEMPLDKKAIEAFKTEHPGIDVLYEPNPGRQYEEKILTGLAAGEPPDVFLLDAKLIPSFTNKNVLLDLAPLVRELSIDTSQWFHNVLDIARRDGALYAFPKGFTPLMIYYNKKLFREGGVPFPDSGWTWDDYLEKARKLTRDIDGDGKPDRYGTSFTNYYYYWIPWVWSAGGDVVDPGGRTATGYLNSPKTEAALRYLIDLRTKEGVAPDVGSWIQSEKTGTNYALFAGGKIAMVVDGHWRMPTFMKFLREGKLDIGVAPFPRYPGGTKVNVVYESGWCIPVNAKHPKEAALLALFMAGAAAGEIRSAGKLEIPSNISVAAKSMQGDSTGMERAFVEEIPFCRLPWGARIERFSEIEWTLQDAVDEVMLNGKPLHETMTRYAARVDAQLNEIRSHEHSQFKPIAEHSEILSVLFIVVGVSFSCCILFYLKARKSDRARLAVAAGFLTPSFLHLIVFIFTPIVFAAYLAFHRWDIIVPDQPFVGLDNFREIFSDPSFWNALKNTFLYSLYIPVCMAAALLTALLLQRHLTGLGFLRALFFLPGVTSFVAVALVWMWIYHPTFGLANYLLGMFGLPPLQWLNSTQTAMISLIVFSVWFGLGYQMVIFLAGLQGIPDELYDASRIDGANAVQRFLFITLPLLKPTTLFVLVTSFIASFQAFTSVYVMTAGGPVGSTDVFVYHIYQSAWEQLRMGYAAAMSWILFVIVMMTTWLQFKLMGKGVEY